MNIEHKASTIKSTANVSIERNNRYETAAKIQELNSRHDLKIGCMS